MKNPLQHLFPLTLALCGLSFAVSAPAPSFVPEAPGTGAQALVEAYLPLLAAGEYDQAIPLNDLRAMREYFLDRRLTELKADNPEMTAQDLDEMSAQIQLNDLNPLRLKDILLHVLEEGDFVGMSWKIEGYAPIPEIPGGYLVRVGTQTASGQEKPLLLAIKKLGAQWVVAPDIIEKLKSQVAAAPRHAEQPVPPEVRAIVNTFWTHWKQGELTEVHALFGAAYRKRSPLLPFLQQAQEVMKMNGIPLSWTVMQCRPIGPALLGLGVDVEGSKATMQTLMIFRKMGDTWVLEDSQYRAIPVEVELTPSPPAPARTAPSFRPDLRPDFKAPLLSTPSPSNSLKSH
jgi:hypothetical protein